MTIAALTTPAVILALLGRRMVVDDAPDGLPCWSTVETGARTGGDFEAGPLVDGSDEDAEPAEPVLR